jgi:NAD(P)-dependent dehydrogenase (short-subunit alcohol dehydrogenase family)
MTTAPTISAGRLAGKVVLISGAASDIGAAIAARCVAEGGSVICADLDGQASRELASGFGSIAIGIACDVTDLTSVRDAVQAGLDAFGRIDGFVHNAAAPSLDRTVIDLDPADWAREIGVSLTGAFLMSKFAVPAIVSAGGGSVVLIASQFGHVATAQSVAYCAAKAGVIHLAKAMAIDHAPAGVRVNSLSPGAVRTSRLLQRWPDLDQADADLGPAYLLNRIGLPEEIAAAAAFLLSPDASFITGTDLLVDGGYAAR